ncbi:MAG: (4Fe-4S)-binding protein [Methylococcaceae bacterium]|nr:(4Fe-4S)-binding protein [Methylococcaceae bacterium]
MEIKWDASKCCHAGVCVKSLPEVFKIESGEFVIDPANADEQKIKDVVSQCPSGALECAD